jgi:hypothetical protein
MSRVLLHRAHAGRNAVTEDRGTWSLWRDRVYVCCPDCGTTLRIDHEITETGDVNPSVGCPTEVCSWHVYVTLAGWSGGHRNL